MVSDVEQHLRQNGPWFYKLSQFYDAPEVTAAVERIGLQTESRSPHECTNLMHSDLKDTHVLRQQDVLIQDNLPAGDLPGTVDVPQDVLALADLEVLLGSARVL